MNPGYVYILINPSLPDLIKIGATVRDPRRRARELSTTGVPARFQVAFQTFSDDFKQLEAAIHRELNSFRPDARREFFRHPLNQAIAKLQHLNRKATETRMIFLADDITLRLHMKCPNYLRSDITAIRIVQTSERVWLEIVIEDTDAHIKDQSIRRFDLGAHEDEEGHPRYRPQDDVQMNAQKFVDDFDEDICCSIMDLVDPKEEEADISGAVAS